MKNKKKAALVFVTWFAIFGLLGDSEPIRGLVAGAVGGVILLGIIYSLVEFADAISPND